MLSDEDLLKLQKIAQSFKEELLESINLIKKGVEENAFFFLKMLQGKVPFLSLIDDASLERIGNIILDYLPQIKTYNGLVYILKAIYNESATVFFVQSQKNGEVNIDIEGDLMEFDTYIFQDNNDWVFQDENEAVTNGYGTFEGRSFKDFLYQFILAGVNIGEITINGQKVIRVLSKDTNILTNKENILKRSL
jgi:hypothetical protein